MDADAWIWRLDESLPSETGAGRRVLDAVLGQLDRHGWNHDDIFAVHLSLEEALVNAIRHGNRSDESKRVGVFCGLAIDRILIQVEDEGCGFCPDEVPDCTQPDRLEVPSGRGLLLMRRFMDRVEYNDCGNCLRLEKFRSA